jgi:hypothetical protein
MKSSLTRLTFATVLAWSSPGAGLRSRTAISLPACQLPTGSSPCTSLSANSSIMLGSYSSIEPNRYATKLSAASNADRPSKLPSSYRDLIGPFAASMLSGKWSSRSSHSAIRVYQIHRLSPFLCSGYGQDLSLGGREGAASITPVGETAA